MIVWHYSPDRWLDLWFSSCNRCMITRHPRKDRGEHVIWIDGERVGQTPDLAFAKWKAINHLEGAA